MKEQFTGIPKNQNFGRAEGGQTRFSADREQQEKTRENIRNIRDYKQPSWFQSSSKGTLTEIRDILRRQEISREFEEVSAFSDRLNEKLDRKRAEAFTEPKKEEEKLTLGKVIARILGAFISVPIKAAKESFDDTKRQAEHAEAA